MELADIESALGPIEPKFRARQIYDAVYRQRAASYGDVSALPKSPARTSDLSRLRAQSQQASDGLTQLQQAVLGVEVHSQVSTASIITGSRVLDPATPLARSWLRTRAAYAATGLIAGCILGICFVIVQALITGRLRRRERGSRGRPDQHRPRRRGIRGA